MGGVHLLIGLGEAAITVAVLSAVLAVRPDLVRGARHLRRDLVLAPRPPAGARPVSVADAS
jgi:cobalt/nickel transport system permease protein